MIVQYKLILHTGSQNFRQEWAYPLYSALMNDTEPEFAENVHEQSDRITPLSQYLRRTNEGILWTVSLFGENSITALAPLLDSRTEFILCNEKIPLYVSKREFIQLNGADDLLASAKASEGSDRCLRFRTPAAFKSKGQYINFPTVRLILQNLIRKWNACMDGFRFGDTEADVLSEGLLCRQFNIQDRRYFVKGNPIPGYVGEMIFQNIFDGEEHDRADALLSFAGYAGVGIKTALGMGGVE